jgi:hypothetical protein
VHTQRLLEALGERRHPVLLALALVDADLAAVEVNVGEADVD